MKKEACPTTSTRSRQVVGLTYSARPWCFIYFYFHQGAVHPNMIKTTTSLLFMSDVGNI